MYLMLQTRNSDQPAQIASLIRVSILRKTIFLFLSIKNNQDRNSTVEQHRRWSDWTEALWNFDFSTWRRNASTMITLYMCNLAVNWSCRHTSLECAFKQADLHKHSSHEPKNRFSHEEDKKWNAAAICEICAESNWKDSQNVCKQNLKHL